MKHKQNEQILSVSLARCSLLVLATLFTKHPDKFLKQSIESVHPNWYEFKVLVWESPSVCR